MSSTEAQETPNAKAASKEVRFGSWEFYDAQKKRKLIMRVVTPLMALLWIIMFVLVVFVTTEMELGARFRNPYVQLVISFILFLLLGLVIVYFVVRLNRDKRNWYFAATQFPNNAVKWDDAANWMKNFLKNTGYYFVEASHRGSAKSEVMFFDIQGADYSIRLYRVFLMGMIYFEVGIGPENALNRDRITRLRDEIGKSFTETFLQKNAPPGMLRSSEDGTRVRW